MANTDQLVVIASGAIPVTDPFLIDRVVSIAEGRNCQPVICINKCDLDAAEELYQTYRAAGFPTLRVSAETGEGLEELSGAIAGKVSTFYQEIPVMSKSSILNALEPGFRLQVGEVSDKLGRGRHTTRHVELFRLRSGAIVTGHPQLLLLRTRRDDSPIMTTIIYLSGVRPLSGAMPIHRLFSCKGKGLCSSCCGKGWRDRPQPSRQLCTAVSAGKGSARMGTEMKRALLFGSVPCGDGAFLRPYLDGGGWTVFCADGGVRNARAAGLRPDYLIGDWDSGGAPEGDVPCITLPVEKDMTDLQAAVDQALELDYRELLLCGCTGGRLDHTASNLVLLEWIADHGGRALLVDADNEVRLLDSGVLRLTNRPCYHYLSLVPLDRRVTGVTLRGLRYPLTDAVLTRGDTLSVSNEPLGDEVEICLSAGRALLIRSQRV